MDRRTVVRALTGILIPTAECSGVPLSDKKGNGSKKNTQTPAPDQKQQVIADERINTKQQYKATLKEGQKLKIAVDVAKGGPLTVKIVNENTGKPTYNHKVKSKAKMRVIVESGGVHQITFQGAKAAHVKVVAYS